MWQIIETMPVKTKEAPFHFDQKLLEKEAHWSRDKNIRDVLVHLYEWHQLLLLWVKENKDGKEHPFLPAPYNWKTYGLMNIAFWQKHQDTSYETAVNLVQASHIDVMRMIDEHTDEELFTKKFFSWTGTTSLGSYCISATSAHYDWAIKKLKLHIKVCKIEGNR
ncbi:MAG: ClbS/DfsB family four-helix bundle protein [Streptococcaceae bacterium]|jgi:hypothetical protein|nr:ClbS/DfsB family four-helix bundle protein [Streptococcaceae bacterium]